MTSSEDPELANQASHESEALEANFRPDEWRGIFVMQGLRLELSNITLTEAEDGSISCSPITVSTGVEMAPYWLACAVEHAERAEHLSHATNKAWQTNDPDAQRVALEAEFRASLQAITGAVFTIDSFYATLVDAAPVPESTRKAWRKNKTRRSRQVFETIRRNFGVGPKSQLSIKELVDQLYSFRDQGVHPTAKTREAHKHPRLPVGVDRVFCIFRARNAWIAVGHTIEMLDSLTKFEKIKSRAVVDRMLTLQGLLSPIIESWRGSSSGQRYDREPAAPKRPQSGEAPRP